MYVEKNQAGNLLPITSINGIEVTVITSPEHEFLMDTYQVAYGYGISASCLRSHFANHSDEFTEGKHYVSGVHILDSGKKTPHNKTFWTKRGIVRLGFFVKSERAKLFRDWAEELVINAPNTNRTSKGALPARRNHNRLSPDRLLSIMADICKIEDKALRLSLRDKLMGGGNE